MKVTWRSTLAADGIAGVAMNFRRTGIALLAVALLAAGCTKSTPGSGPGTTTALAQGSVLAVKIDNVTGARPATGLASADVIYVEPVEGGLTRIIAIFSSKIPDLVGPVRSARETDIGVLGQYGRPTFAYSGAAPQIIPKLHAASVVNAAQSDVPNAYVRQSTHAAPHNLYLHPAGLPAGSGPTPQTVLDFGAAPAGGTAAPDTKLHYAAAAYEIRWAGDKAQIWMDGTPFTSTEGGQLGAATVIEQRVNISYEPFPEDETGAHAPIAQTVGSGPAVVLREGQSYQATWSRSDAGSPTRFTTTSGQDLPLATGPVWIFLLPVNG